MFPVRLSANPAAPADKLKFRGTPQWTPKPLPIRRSRALPSNCLRTSRRSAIRCQLLPLEHPAAKDHLYDFVVGLHGLSRVGAEQQQVGALADLDGADVVVELQRLRISQRGHLEDLRRGHTCI